MWDDGLGWLAGACLLGAAVSAAPEHRPVSIAVEWPAIWERLERAWLDGNVCGEDPTVCLERSLAGP